MKNIFSNREVLDKINDFIKKWKMNPTNSISTNSIMNLKLEQYDAEDIFQISIYNDLLTPLPTIISNYFGLEISKVIFSKEELLNNNIVINPNNLINIGKFVDPLMEDEILFYRTKFVYYEIPYFHTCYFLPEDGLNFKDIDNIFDHEMNNEGKIIHSYINYDYAKKLSKIKIIDIEKFPIKKLTE